MEYIDMRSDTVTRPTAGMRQAMATAVVGDDVFGDDPTVLRLQETVAALLNKEAALFVPSGTMGNQLAIKSQTRSGDQIVVEGGAHIYRYEAGAPAVLSGVLVTCVDVPGGQIRWEDVAPVLNPNDLHCAPPTLVCLENTHNRAGGRVLPRENVVEIAENAHDAGLRVHLDGARLWHAHIATGISLAELAAPADSVSVCFSKALGAPIGSVLASDHTTIARAHRLRKMWGGGMRQVGVLAAASLYALENHLSRLAEDHEAARRIVAGLDHPLLKVNHPVDSNIVIIDVAGTDGHDTLLEHLRGSGVLAIGFGPGRVRLVPNLDCSAAAVQSVIAALNSMPGDQN